MTVTTTSSRATIAAVAVGAVVGGATGWREGNEMESIKRRTKDWGGEAMTRRWMQAIPAFALGIGTFAVAERWMPAARGELACNGVVSGVISLLVASGLSDAELMSRPSRSPVERAAWMDDPSLRGDS